MHFTEHPFWSYAFRPLYLLAAIYGAISVLLWAFGYQGTATLPSWLWHAHEMIWGYAGAIVVAFLLTAVATWTQQPPTQGKILIILTLLWLAARISAFFPHHIFSAVFGTLFYVLAAVCMAKSVWQTRNTRNYLPAFALFLFGALHAAFHLCLALNLHENLHNGLLAGLLMVAAFIGLVGTRIISFFTAKRLGTQQVPTSPKLALTALLLPMVSAVLLFHQILLPVAAVCSIAAGVLAGVQGMRWWQKGVLKEPLLWVLHLGYAFTALGLIVMGAALWLPAYLSMGVHLIAVGGIGLLTVGMMTRTALGHTGRPLYPCPKPMPLAFVLMALAAVFRTVAALLIQVSPTGYQHSLRLAAVLFAASLLLFAWRYLPWLISERADGSSKTSGVLKIIR
ncbi:MAG: NnrS family protein [Neisseria sp.]|nr:NnrS family protein [Neisseria sp.]